MPPFSNEWWVLVAAAAGCVSVAALAAGLTMGMVGLDPFQLSVINHADLNDTKDAAEREALKLEKVAARRLIGVVSKHHWLLVTLLLCNAAANEALPLFLDRLVPAWLAVVLSVSFVLVFGEILPSALFTGPSQLIVSSYFTAPVRLLMLLLSPIGWPLAKALDCMFGEEHVQGYQRAEIKAIVSMHGDPAPHSRTVPGVGAAAADATAAAHDRATDMLRLGGLTTDEVMIMQGVFACGTLQVMDCMLDFDSPDLFMLDSR